jgi:hypothetical protein
LYVTKNGERKQVALFLSKKDDRHHSRSCKLVRAIAGKILLEENSRIVEHGGLTAQEFWAGI